jgi:3-methyladenine DNA glycosylase AlkD
MTATDVLAELETLGSAQTKKTFLRHGAPEPFFGVKIGDLKTIQKRLKVNHALAIELYTTGNSDAMYLAGLIADPKQMTKAHLQKWAKGATWYMLSDFTVAGVAAESPFGWDLGLEWIDSKKELIASAGWNTLSGVLSITPDQDLDPQQIEALLKRIETQISSAPNRVRYAMNGFVISVGTYVASLLAKAKQTAKKVGTVAVNMGETECKVPQALESIAKVETMKRVGKKRTTARC